MGVVIHCLGAVGSRARAQPCPGRIVAPPMDSATEHRFGARPRPTFGSHFRRQPYFYFQSRTFVTNRPGCRRKSPSSHSFCMPSRTICETSWRQLSARSSSPGRPVSRFGARTSPPRGAAACAVVGIDGRASPRSAQPCRHGDRKEAGRDSRELMATIGHSPHVAALALPARDCGTEQRDRRLSRRGDQLPAAPKWFTGGSRSSSGVRHGCGIERSRPEALGAKCIPPTGRTSRGGGRNRTAVRGFAGPCLNHSATPPRLSAAGRPA